MIHLMTDVARCIAYWEDGRICKEPAKVLDLQRGGVVCKEQARSKTPTCADAGVHLDQGKR